MSMPAGAVTGLVNKIIASLGPQVLKPLLLRPTSGPTLRLEVGQDPFFEGLKACRVHVGRHAAVLVGADHSNGLSASEVLLGDEDVLGVAAVVVKATLGVAAGPGPVHPVELEPDRVRAEARAGQGVVVRIATVGTHLPSVRI